MIAVIGDPISRSLPRGTIRIGGGLNDLEERRGTFLQRESRMRAAKILIMLTLAAAAGLNGCASDRGSTPPAALKGELHKLSSELQDAYRAHESGDKPDTQTLPGALVGNTIVIEAAAEHNPQTLKADLQRLGLAKVS